MPYPYEIGALFPSEGAFRRPEGYRQFLQAQATQRSSFLSTMDQFYEKLNETVREFDATLGFKEKALTQERDLFMEELDWEREALDKQLAQQWNIHEDEMNLAKQELDVKQFSAREEAEYRQGLLDVQRSGIDAESRYRSGMLDIQRSELGLKRDALAAEQEAQAAQLDFLRESAENQREGYSEISSALEKLFAGGGTTQQPGQTSAEVTPTYTSTGGIGTPHEDIMNVSGQDTTDWWGYY